MAIGVTFTVLIVAVYVILQTTILPRFDEQEERSTQRDVLHAVESIGERLDSLDRVTSDWAKWDDLYAFVAGQNPSFVETNVVDETFRNVRLNVMLFVQTSGTVVEARGFDLVAGRRAPVPPSLLAHLQGDSPLRSRTDASEGSKGIVMLPEGPLLVSARPIVRSDGQGPARGTVIWGRYLDAQALKQVAAKTGLSLTLYRPDEPGASDEIAAAWTALAAGLPTLVRPLDATSIAGYARLADIYGRPVLLLRVDEPRVIHAQGQAFAWYLVWALLAVVLGGGVVSAVLLERLVLSRVARLGAAIHDIGTRGDLSARVALPGGDELSGLAGAVNGMLASLSHTQAQNERLEAAVAARARDLAEANERLTILDRSKNEFLNLISHELRTPLNGLLGVGDLILEGSPSTEENNELQEMFDQSRRRILSLLDDALLLTQIDVSGGQFRSTPVPLYMVLSRAIERTTEFAKSRRVEFILPSADLDLVRGDEDLLVRAFHALLETAVKFSEEGETVRVSRDDVLDSPRVVIESRGRTIPGPALAKFFDLFSIAEASTPGGDLGLGPPVAYRILSLFGASVGVASRDPSGIRLTILLENAARKVGNSSS